MSGSPAPSPAACPSTSTQDADDPCRWTVDETFVDAAAFEAHRARTRASGWPSVTSHMVRDIQVSE
jgi:quinol monooxygenase YgiN